MFCVADQDGEDDGANNVGRLRHTDVSCVLVNLENIPLVSCQQIYICTSQFQSSFASLMLLINVCSSFWTSQNSVADLFTPVLVSVLGEHRSRL